MPDTPGENGGPGRRRILLKLSGEALAGEGGFGIDGSVLASVAGELQQIVGRGVQTGVVVGGGNFFRGLSSAAEGMDRIGADYIGMLATVMNALSLQQALRARGQAARVLSALPIAGVVEPYVRDRALKHLQRGRVVIFAAGTGNPLFTTDTAACLRAIEIGADLMAKATRVDGVYDDDPEQNPGAKRFDRLTYDEALRRGLKVMDLTALTLCRENGMPIRVFNLHHAGSLLRVAGGEAVGTLVTA